MVADLDGPQFAGGVLADLIGFSDWPFAHRHRRILIAQKGVWQPVPINRRLPPVPSPLDLVTVG